MRADGVHGVLVLDKPGGMTSRAAVNRVQAWFPLGTKVGHTGTLDPLATGVLVTCLGQATRLAEFIQAMPKIYRSKFLLGARSDTDDADGTITPSTQAQPIPMEDVQRECTRFVGSIEQTPPAFSAAKVAGERAHDLARQGHKVNLKPRNVQIDRFDILAYSWPLLEVEVACSKGTYIRSLARDLGEKLGCGALVQTLRRTRVGPFTTDDAVTLEMTAVDALQKLRPVSDAVQSLPSVVVSPEDVVRLRQGQSIRRPADGIGKSPPGASMAILDVNGQLVGIGELDAAGTLLHPSKILAPPP